MTNLVGSNPLVLFLSLPLLLGGCGENPEVSPEPAPPEPSSQVDETQTASAETQAFWLTPLEVPDLGEPPARWQLMDRAEKRAFLEDLDVVSDPQEGLRLLLHGINDPDAEVREMALEEGADLPATLEAVLIQQVLADPVPELRYEALDQLKDIDGPEALPVLHQAMQSPLPDVRRIAGSQLTFRGNKPSLEILFQGLRDPDDVLREKTHENINFLIGHRFRSYDHARQWWAEHGERFDAELFEKDQ